MYICAYMCVRMCAYAYIQRAYRDKSKRGFPPRTREPNRDKSAKRNPVSTTGISAKSRRRASRYHRLDLASSFKPLGHHTRHARILYANIFFLYTSRAYTHGKRYVKMFYVTMPLAFVFKVSLLIHAVKKKTNTKERLIRS